MQDISVLLDPMKFLFISHTIGPTQSPPCFSSTTVYMCPIISDLLSEVYNFSTMKPYALYLKTY